MRPASVVASLFILSLLASPCTAPPGPDELQKGVAETFNADMGEGVPDVDAKLEDKRGLFEAFNPKALLSGVGQTVKGAAGAFTGVAGGVMDAGKTVAGAGGSLINHIPLVKDVHAVAIGTVASSVDAMGQTVQNVAGDDSFLGKVAGAFTGMAESFAGAVKFILYTQKNPWVGQLLTKENIDATNWDKTQNTIFISHGFTPAGYFELPFYHLIACFKVRDGLLKANITANILVIDWTGLSSDGMYMFSSTATATTAEEVSKLALWLISNRYIDSPKNLRVIGHSLGSHVAGITGKKLKLHFKEKLARVDAIDPAGPNFDQSISPVQLAKDDATFVHALHCNTGMFGSSVDRGSVDFYPNGGNNLPHCDPKRKRKKRLILDQFVTTNICRHCHCIDLYVETITREIMGCKCESWEAYNSGTCDCKEKARLGYHCPEDSKGTYYMNITMTTEYFGVPNIYANYSDYMVEVKPPSSK